MKNKFTLLLLWAMLTPSWYYAQFYNDGQIRLRIWVHKVWSNVDDALCVSGPEYVFRNIQVRVPNPTGGFDTSPLGLHLKTDNCNQSEWIAFDPLEACVSRQVPAGGGYHPMTSSNPEGILVFDRTYSTTVAPNSFDWRMGEVFEDDCGDPWTYQSSCGFLGLESDDSRVFGNWNPAYHSFRGAPPGEIHYVQSDGLESDGEFNAYYLLLAF